MPDRFLDYSFLTIVWVAGLSIVGGVANYARKVSERIIKRFSIVEFMGELFISGFAGIITFLLCESASVDLKLTAALVGISGHMGSRAIFMLEQFINKKITTALNIDTSE